MRIRPRRRLVVFLSLLLLAPHSSLSGPVLLAAPAGADAPPPTAAALGLMQGAPPPADREVTIHNFMAPPYNRWGLQHLREVVPTRGVPATGTPAELPERPVDLAALEVDFADGRRVRVGGWLEAAYTDGFIVLHHGAVVFERYFNGLTPGRPHLSFSVTKSFTGTLLLMLAEEGRVDLGAPVHRYLPELAATAFGDATVQQMLDMTVSIDYDEDYTRPDADFAGYLEAMLPDGGGLYRHLRSLTRPHPVFAHGQAFHYVTPVPEVLGWIIRRVTGQTLADHLHARIWSKLGAGHEAYYWLDFRGVELAAVGLAMTLRDAARFGQMILQDGHYNGRRILSAEIARRIRTKRNQDRFALFYEDPWYGEVADSYHDQWWGYAGQNAVAALGIHGQFIYIHSDAGVVIAKQSSDPDAESERVDGETALVMHAIAAELQTRSAP